MKLLLFLPKEAERDAAFCRCGTGPNETQAWEPAPPVSRRKCQILLKYSIIERLKCIHMLSELSLTQVSNHCGGGSGGR